MKYCNTISYFHLRKLVYGLVFASKQYNFADFTVFLKFVNVYHHIFNEMCLRWQKKMQALFLITIESILNIFCSLFLLLLLFLLFLLWNEMSVIFSDFLLSNEMPWYTENISTTIFFIRVLFLSYELVKVYRNNMDHPVCV